MTTSTFAPVVTANDLETLADVPCVMAVVEPSCRVIAARAGAASKSMASPQSSGTAMREKG